MTVNTITSTPWNNRVSISANLYLNKKKLNSILCLLVYMHLASSLLKGGGGVCSNKNPYEQMFYTLPKKNERGMANSMFNSIFYMKI